MLFFIKKSTILGVLKTQMCYIALNPHMLYYVRGAVGRLKIELIIEENQRCNEDCCVIVMTQWYTEPLTHQHLPYSLLRLISTMLQCLQPLPTHLQT